MQGATVALGLCLCSGRRKNSKNLRLPNVLLLLVFAGSALAAQVIGDDLAQRCGGAYNLCGFVWADTEEIVIPFQYEYVSGFSEDLALVKIEGKCGYISPDGEIAIAPTLEMGGDFRLGLVEARLDGQSRRCASSGSLKAPLVGACGASLAGCYFRPMSLSAESGPAPLTNKSKSIEIQNRRWSMMWLSAMRSNHVPMVLSSAMWPNIST